MLLVSENISSWNTDEVSLQSKRGDGIKPHFLIILFMVNYNQMIGTRIEMPI